MTGKNNLFLSLLVLMLFVVSGCNLLRRNTVATNTSPTASPTPSMKNVITELRNKSDGLGKFDAPPKLDPKAKIKGKIAIIEGDKNNIYHLVGFYDTDFSDSELEQYGLTRENIATKVEDIDTLVQTNCAKGEKIGTYKTDDGVVPAYGLNCETKIIDYKTPAVVAKKSFKSSSLSEVKQLDKRDKEVIAYRPDEEIKKYVKSMMAKK